MTIVDSTLTFFMTLFLFMCRAKKEAIGRIHPGPAPDLAVEDELGSHVLAQVDSFKDLGVLHSPDMKHHAQVDAAVAKARSAAYLIRRAFTYHSSRHILP